MADESPFAKAYLDEAQRSFRGYKRLAEAALAQLSDADLFYSPDRESNSIAVIIKHIGSNLRLRWTNFLTSEVKRNPNRDQEFEMDEGMNREQLLCWWEDGWNCVFQSLADLRPEDFNRTVYIRREPHSVLQATNRSLAHIAYHVGQIVYLGKHLRQSEWKSLSMPKANPLIPAR
jgi:hypothetical protein